MKKVLATILLCTVAGTALAQQGPPIPSPLELATIPGLSAEQQSGLHKILLQRRDAEEALFSKQHAEFDALRAKTRNEHERIDESTTTSLRQLLGDEGYRKFAEWQLAQRPGPRGPGLPPPHGPGRPPRDGGPMQGPGPLPPGAPVAASPAGADE